MIFAQLEFVDLDELIVRAHGDIPTIFEKQGEAWQKSGEICVLKVTASAEATAAGTLLRQQVSAVADGETYFTLPVARYQEVQP